MDGWTQFQLYKLFRKHIQRHSLNSLKLIYLKDSLPEETLHGYILGRNTDTTNN